MGIARIPYVLGHHEIARLYGVARDVPQLWRKRSLLGEPDLVVSGNPYWLLPTVLALAEPGHRKVDPKALADYKRGFKCGYSTQVLEEPPSLIGLQEVSWIFGKKTSAIGQWRNRGTLAPPDLNLSGSPLWCLNTILMDAEQRGRSVSAEAVERIRGGERAQPKPRGRVRAAEEPHHPLPPRQIFSSNEGPAALRFVRSVLNAGHAVEVRPRRSDTLDPASDQPTEPDSRGSAEA